MHCNFRAPPRPGCEIPPGWETQWTDVFGLGLPTRVYVLDGACSPHFLRCSLCAIINNYKLLCCLSCLGSFLLLPMDIISSCRPNTGWMTSTAHASWPTLGKTAAAARVDRWRPTRQTLALEGWEHPDRYCECSWGRLCHAFSVLLHVTLCW